MKIAKNELGDVSKWETIWNINKSNIVNKNLIRPKDVLIMPAR
ncbi:MAG: hypothetical protein HQL61_10220 [Magnetococcales bacterium]|uniref:LysM domain-containing protein n=1 Tax=Candidatus Magnetobacterium casense TaxID=1455061 RepID=A0ABS6RW73_9BACT|nr:hypothetical protein [Nitrospirota bacterium]MBV6340879.1 hypothetical protein [Candidatus Magnetobacterium casensis]